MSIIKMNGCCAMRCDTCLEYGAVAMDTWGCIDNGKDEGWRFIRMTGHWDHQCPACAGKMKSPAPAVADLSQSERSTTGAPPLVADLSLYERSTTRKGGSGWDGGGLLSMECRVR